VPDPNTLVARSKRQALDWSLALVSQDIASTLTRSADTSQWTLVVSADDYPRALETIRLYQLENRGWTWRRRLPAGAIAFHWGSLVWVGLLALIYGVNVLSGNGLETAGVLDTQALHSGQWWRLFTAVTLHADVGHLAGNLSIGLFVLGLAMGRFGPGFALLAAYLAGVGGNLFAFVLRPDPYLGLGASGMVMGGLGLLTAESVSLWRHHPRSAQFILSGVGAGVMLLVLFGLDPRADVLAHVGGFIVGSLLGAGLAFLPHRLLQSPGLNLVAGLVLSGCVLGNWWLAIR
jgi:membrane associated rhomboid family serine protease